MAQDWREKLGQVKSWDQDAQDAFFSQFDTLSSGGASKEQAAQQAFDYVRKGVARQRAYTRLVQSGLSDDEAKQQRELHLDALIAKASDIHVEPLRGRLRVRFRCDGVMTIYRDYENSVTTTLLSRIKIMAGASISEKRRHQDGRSALAMPSSGSNVMAHLNTPLSLFETQAVAPFSQRNDLH